MARHARHILLEQKPEAGTIRFLTGLNVQLAEGRTRSTVTVTRAGEFFDPRYGQFSITREMLLSMVENFNKRVYGQDIFIDVATSSIENTCTSFSSALLLLASA